MINVDPDGHSLWSKAAKFAYKWYKKGDAGAAAKETAEDALTVADSSKSTGERVWAGISLATEISPISIRDAKDVYRGVKGFFKKSDPPKLLTAPTTAKPQSTDFVVTEGGTAVPVSQKRMREGFDQAGFPSKQAQSPSGKEKGMIHTVPTKSGKKIDVRTMEGGPNHPRRAVFNTPGTHSARNPDGGTPKGTKQQIREESHLKQTP